MSESKSYIGKGVAMVIGLVLMIYIIALIMPDALVNLAVMDEHQTTVNGTVYTLGSEVDSGVLTMYMVLLPLISAIVIIMFFVRKIRS